MRLQPDGTSPISIARSSSRSTSARVLERELRSPRWSAEPVAMGTNTDPYQRAEGRYRLMPGIIDALARSGTPFSVLTKGTVLTRDLPRLAAAAADVPVARACPSRCSTARCSHAGARHPHARRAPRPRAPHHRRRPAVRRDGGARAADAHRLDRGARRPPRPGRRGGRHRGERARPAPAARHPRVVPGLAGAGAPGTGRAVRPAVPARGVRGARVPARARGARRATAAAPRSTPSHRCRSGSSTRVAEPPSMRGAPPIPTGAGSPEAEQLALLWAGRNLPARARGAPG